MFTLSLYFNTDSKSEHTQKKKYAPTAPAASLNLNAGPKTAGENENGGVASEKASDGRAPPDILAMFNKLSSETKENRKKNNDPNDYPYRNTK